MKLKIALLVLLCFFVGIAQQKDKKQSAEKGKWEELIKYPTPIEPIQPEYPQVAKLAGIEGKVFIEALVDRTGNVVETKILKSDHESLIGAAVAAIKTTKFYPAVSKENDKVDAWVVIPISFKLAGDSNSKKNLADEDPEMNAFVAVEKLPELVESVKPEYPEIAKRAGIIGKVFVKVLVDKEGVAKKAVVIRSDSELFNPSATNAAMKSKFTPAMQGGKPIAVWIVLPFNFTLDGKEPKRDFQVFKSVEEAQKAYQAMVNFFKNPNEMKKKGTVPEMKTEILQEDISYGDESFLSKTIAKGKNPFVSLIARRGNAIYKFIGESLEEVKKYVEEMKASDKK